MALAPDLQSSLLCDDVRQERNGKFFLIGIYDGLAVPRLPVTAGRICVVNRWCNGEGVYHQRTRIIGVDGHTVFAQGREIEVTLPTVLQTATTIEAFINLPFKDAGTYWIEVSLNTQLRIRYPLELRVLPPPRDQQQPAPPASL